MAYPTGLLSLTLQDIDRRMLRVKDYVQLVRDQSASVGLTSPKILDLWSFLKAERAVFAAAGSIPGLVAYARTQKDNGSLDVVAEFQSVMAAIDMVTDWIATNHPKDAGGYILAQSFGTATLTDRQFSTGALATFRTNLDALLATIT